MRHETEEELKAAHDAEVAESALVKTNSKQIAEYMRSRWGEVPSEITRYLNREPLGTALENAMSSMYGTSNQDEAVAAF